MTSWKKFGETLWFAYGTMLGENEADLPSVRRTHAIRWAIATWLLFCLVVTQSFAGNLKAFLTTPSFTEPINTLKEVMHPDQLNTWEEKEKGLALCRFVKNFELRFALNVVVSFLPILRVWPSTVYRSWTAGCLGPWSCTVKRRRR